MTDQQAQAGEPEVAARANYSGTSVIVEADLSPGVELITLQSHRDAMAWHEREIKLLRDEKLRLIIEREGLQEAIAKKDAALKACVEALERLLDDSGYGRCLFETDGSTIARASITQAREAMK